MKKLTAILLAAQFFLSGVCSAETFDTLNYSQRLRRLSFSTRGRDASDADKDALRSLRRTLNRNQVDAWFAARAQAYTASDDFESKMIGNLSNLFLIREPFDTYDLSINSLQMLFHKVLSENQSWDQLLMSQVIGISKSTVPSGGAAFYQSALNQQDLTSVRKYLEQAQLDVLSRQIGAGTVYNQAPPPDQINWADVGVYQTVSSPEIAGVLTDPEFLQRYWTTPINQNRKRSAQVFRIFLCDEMHAVILPDSKALQDIESAGLDVPPQTSSATISQQDVQAVARHANDQRCSTCHSKLDPLGNVFRAGANHLPSVPIAGALSYKRVSGEQVNVPFRNAQELAKAIVAQPEYASCQVHHFWNWFVGSDIAMSPQTEAELVKKFNEVGRKPRDFANYLVNRQEFYKFPKLTIDTVQFRHVSGLFQACQSCHANQSDAPDLSKLPFSNIYFDDHGAIIDKIISHVDLLGDGSKATMPPTKAGWKVTGSNRTLLMAWLADGAPDDNGKTTWSNTTQQNQIRQRLQDEQANFDLRPTFDFTAHRRLTTIEFKRQLSALALEITGKPMDNQITYNPYQGASTIEFNLDSGTYISNPNLAYAKDLQSTANNFVNILQYDSDQLTKLNLDFLNSNGALHPGNVASPSLCEQIGHQLFWRLFGTAPTATEAQNLKNFAAQLPAGSDFTDAVGPCVRDTLEQLLLSSRYLTY